MSTNRRVRTAWAIIDFVGGSLLLAAIVLVFRWAWSLYQSPGTVAVWIHTGAAFLTFGLSMAAYTKWRTRASRRRWPEATARLDAVEQAGWAEATREVARRRGGT